MNTITTSLGSCPRNKFSWLLTRLPACYVECFHDLLVNQVLSTGPCIKAQPVPKALCAIHTVCTPHKQQDMGNKRPAGPCCQGAHQTNAVFAVHQLNFYICTVQQNCVLKEQVAVEQSQAFGPPALGQQSCLSCFLLSAPCCLAGTFQSSPMEKCVGSVTAVSVQRHK